MTDLPPFLAIHTCGQGADQDVEGELKLPEKRIPRSLHTGHIHLQARSEISEHLQLNRNFPQHPDSSSQQLKAALRHCYYLPGLEECSSDLSCALVFWHKRKDSAASCVFVCQLQQGSSCSWRRSGQARAQPPSEPKHFGHGAGRLKRTCAKQAVACRT